MKRVELEVFSDEGNHWIVRSAGRQFPALVIQGDSFNSLRVAVRRISQRAAVIGDEALIDEAAGLLQRFDERLAHYEAVLREHDLDLPYVSD